MPKGFTFIGSPAIKAAQHTPGSLCYLVFSSSSRAVLLDAERDYQTFTDCARKAVQDSRGVLVAYCWLPNAAHLLLEVARKPAVRIAADLMKRYAAATKHAPTIEYRRLPVDGLMTRDKLVQLIHGHADELCAQLGVWPWQGPAEPVDRKEKIAQAQRLQEHDPQVLQARRWQAVQLLEAGESPQEIAPALNVSVRAVQGWSKILHERGREALRLSSPCAKSMLSADQQDRLKQLLQAGPQAAGFITEHWTSEAAAQLIEARFDVRYSSSGAWHLLRKLGLTPNVKR